jgi:hypothetical protein
MMRKVTGFSSGHEQGCNYTTNLGGIEVLK